MGDARLFSSPDGLQMGVGLGCANPTYYWLWAQPDLPLVFRSPGASYVAVMDDFGMSGSARHKASTKL